jgi:N-acetyl-anhydromuramyl-L-alanine amidase AmpD
MNNAQELKAHLQDSNKAKMYEAKKMEKKEIKKELQSILKDYHYNSDTENMSKDVVVALENLVKALK